jgi:hypothetical protein
MLPTAELARMGMLPRVEERRRRAWVPAAWALSALALLVLTLVHLWVAQSGKGPIGQAAIVPGHPQLAAFFGMHLVGVLGLFVFGLLLRYARDFSASSRSQRIAPFPFCRERWTPGPRRAMSALVVVLFVVFPLYCQGKFILQFHNEGYVYAKVKSFGAQRPGVRDASQWCVDPEFCQHSGATRYSVVKPFPYFIHEYQYGQLHPPTVTDGTSQAVSGCPDSKVATTAVTFFPIWQPVAVLTFTAWCLLQLGAWLGTVVCTSPGWTKTPAGAVAVDAAGRAAPLGEGGSRPA